MQLDTQWVTQVRDGQSLQGYWVKPRRIDQPLPAILVIQEIWGPDAHIRDIAERLAQSGYVTLAPDLYSHGGRPEVISEARVEELKAFMETVPPTAWADPTAMNQAIDRLPTEPARRIRETLGRLFAPRDNAALCQDLVAWMNFLTQHTASHQQPIGSIGFCMGGGLSFELAALGDPRLRVAQVYYGVAPAEERLVAIQCPVYGFYGQHDPRITDQVPQVAKAMERAGKSFKYTVYPDAGHAFANDTRTSYQVNAARNAWAQSLRYFDQYLSPR